MPLAEAKSLPRAAGWATERLAVLLENEPPRYLVVAGAGSASGEGSMVRTKSVAAASCECSTANSSGGAPGVAESESRRSWNVEAAVTGHGRVLILKHRRYVP